MKSERKVKEATGNGQHNNKIKKIRIRITGNNSSAKDVHKTDIDRTTQ